MFLESVPLPSPLTLLNYVTHRIEIEHGHGEKIDDALLKEDIEVASDYYKSM